jgi:hypothetical protein
MFEKIDKEPLPHFNIKILNLEKERINANNKLSACKLELKKIT